MRTLRWIDVVYTCVRRCSLSCVELIASQSAIDLVPAAAVNTQQQSAAGKCRDRQTDGRTDARQLHKLRSV